MAPKKKERLSCGSRTRSHITYPKKSPKNNFTRREYSETILHRLRPRIHRLNTKSNIVHKVCASEARRKRNRRPVKRCFVQYKKERRYRGNRNRGPRVNPSRKSAGDFRSKNTIVRPIQPSETSAVAKNYRKQTSFIRSIKDYIFYTFREGTKWAKKYICQAFRSDNKFAKISEVPRIKERNAISSSYSHVILQPGQSDYKDKNMRRRCKTTNNQQQDEDGVVKFNGAAVMSKGSIGSRNDVQRINVSGEAAGNFLVASNGNHRHPDVITNHTAICSQANDGMRNYVDKEGKARPQRRRKRRKGCRTKRIVRNVVRYNQMAEIISERHPYVRSICSSSAVISFLKTYSDMNIVSGNECRDKRENNSYENKTEMVMNELDNRGTVPFDETVASDREEVMRYNKKNDKFWKASTENNSSEKITENNQ